MLEIISWNINSIRARINYLLKIIQEQKPDVILLQEIKCTNEIFPQEMIEDLGYNIVIHGQKSYNGVAIISRHPIEDVNIILPNDPDKTHSRYIEALVSIDKRVIRVASVYVPNGQDIDSTKFEYKLNFFDSLYSHFKDLLSYEEILIIGGDFNVAPEPIDVYDQIELKDTIGFHIFERKKFRSLLNLGFIDAYRTCYPKKSEFTWWDYRAGALMQNKGMRIDHFLLSPQAADLLVDVKIDKEIRILDKSSDHAPIKCMVE